MPQSSKQTKTKTSMKPRNFVWCVVRQKVALFLLIFKIIFSHRPAMFKKPFSVKNNASMRNSDM